MELIVKSLKKDITLLRKESLESAHPLNAQSALSETGIIHSVLNVLRDGLHLTTIVFNAQIQNARLVNSMI